MKAAGIFIFAGGFTVGVERAGFDVVAHLEGVDHPNRSTPEERAYGGTSARLNWPDLPIYAGKDTWPLEELAGKVDFVYANPPCAIFSTMGVATTKGRGAWKTDARTSCWFDTFAAALGIAPEVFAIESVCQAYGTGREMVDHLTRRALAAGYSVSHVFVDTQYFGLPQKRKRFFFVAHRAPYLTTPHVDFKKRVTIRDVLAGVHDPGPMTPTNAKMADLAARAEPGGRLCTRWELDAEQKYGPDRDAWPRNTQGKIAGRPSFGDRRLAWDEVCGAFIGDKMYHPDEPRRLGFNEMKAICGYPPDFQLAGAVSGYASLLARAVMPAAGEFVAGAAALTIEHHAAGSYAGMAPSVRRLDFRKPGIEPADLTNEYVGDGPRAIEPDGPIYTPPAPKKSADDGEIARVRESRPPIVRTPPDVTDPSPDRRDEKASRIVATLEPMEQLARAFARIGDAFGDAARAIARLHDVPDRPVALPDATAAPEPAVGASVAAEESVRTRRQRTNTGQSDRLPRVVVDPSKGVRERLADVVADDGAPPKPTPPARRPDSRARGGEGQGAPASRPRPASGVETVADDSPPRDGEGSGRYIQRVLLTNRHTPDEIVGMVLKNFENRKTKRSDVYFNYRKLIDAGVAVPDWKTLGRG